MIVETNKLLWKSLVRAESHGGVERWCYSGPGSPGGTEVGTVLWHTSSHCINIIVRNIVDYVLFLPRPSLKKSAYMKKYSIYY